MLSAPGLSTQAEPDILHHAIVPGPMFVAAFASGLITRGTIVRIA